MKLSKTNINHGKSCRSKTVEKDWKPKENHRKNKSKERDFELKRTFVKDCPHFSFSHSHCMRCTSNCELFSFITHTEVWVSFTVWKWEIGTDPLIKNGQTPNGKRITLLWNHLTPGKSGDPHCYSLKLKKKVHGETFTWHWLTIWALKVSVET